jgi:exopolysaccharide production protein ExoZ
MYWLATAGVVVDLVLRHGIWPSPDHVVRSLLFLPPTPQQVFPLLYPGWTLNFEMLFYVLLALSMWVSRHGFLLAAIITGSLAALDGRSGYHAIDYYLNGRMLEFAAGLLVGLTLSRGIKVDRALGSILLVSSLLLFMVNGGHPRANIGLSWGVPALALVTGLLAFENAALIRSPLVQRLGDASYSIYLAHPFVLWFAQALVGEARHFATALLAVCISVAGGVLLNQYIEKPILGMLKSWLKKRDRTSSPTLTSP